MHHVGFAVLRLHQVGVPGALQFDIGPVARRQNVHVRVQFVGAGRLRERAIVTAWPQPVPPSAVSR